MGLYLCLLPKDLDWKAEGKDLSPGFAAVLLNGFGWDMATNTAWLDCVDTIYSSSPITLLMLDLYHAYPMIIPQGFN